MRVLLFGKKRRQQAPGGRVSKGVGLETYPLASLTEMVPRLPDGTLVYIELAGLGASERERVLGVIPRNPQILFGVIDPTGSIVDVASLFHGGAVDYLGKKLSGTRINAKRISRVLSYAEASGSEEEEDVDGGAQPRTPYIENGGAPSGAVVDGWARIVPGKEYEFAILFVEVDNEEELKKRHEPDNLAGAMETFRAFVERHAASHGGRPWMWTKFGGLVLFPLSDGVSTAPVCGLRLLLSRVFYDVEESPLPGRLSFRMALSTGTTIYKERDTGEIISDSLNSVFHLGKRYTKPGQFYITADAMQLIPQKLKALCVPSGSYEGRRIYRMVPPRSFPLGS